MTCGVLKHTGSLSLIPNPLGQLRFGIWNSSTEDEATADEQYIMKHHNWLAGTTLQLNSNSKAFL